MSDDKESKLIEKIKKLLRLSEDPNNEHVAEAAAQKAQELIDQHNIREEMLVVSDESTQKTREDPRWQGFIFQNRRVQPWAVNLCSALADNNYGIVGIVSGRGVKFCGSAIDFNLCVAMFQWISKQLQDLASNQCNGVREHNSFKLGAVGTIRKRLQDGKKDAEAAMEIEALCNEIDGTPGLVLFQQAITALDDYKKSATKEANKTLSGAWRGGSASADMSAYSKGVEAGHNVSLSGHQIGG